MNTITTEERSIFRSLVGKFGKKLLSPEDLADIQFVYDPDAWGQNPGKSVPLGLEKRYAKGVSLIQNLIRAFEPNNLATQSGS